MNLALPTAGVARRRISRVARLWFATAYCLGLHAIPRDAAAVVTWDFNTPTALGTPPAGWVNDSQSGSPASFQVLANAPSSGVNSLYISTAGNTTQRVKVRTSSLCTSGTYEWRVYIPASAGAEPGARSSIGCFLYSAATSSGSDAREVDFEIGYGAAADRATYGIPAGRLICWMTVQQDNPSGTALSSIPFQPSSASDHIEPGNWYTLQIVMSVDGLGRYVASWYIQKDAGIKMQGRSPFTMGYGPANAFPTSFTIHNSIETLNFMGEFTPMLSKDAYWDYASYDSGGSAGSSDNVITDIESDTTTGGFPPGSDGQWTRFGLGYNGVGVDSNAANAYAGTKSLSTSADWSAGSSYGVRYNVAGASLQLPASGSVRYYAKYDGIGNPLMALSLVEADGDIWTETTPHALTTSYQPYTVILDASYLTLADGSGGGDLDLDVSLIGMDMKANGATSGAPTFHIDQVTWSSGVPVTLSSFDVE